MDQRRTKCFINQIAKMADVYINYIVKRGGTCIQLPDIVSKHIARNSLCMVLCKVPQEIKFTRGQFQLVAAAYCCALKCIDV